MREERRVLKRGGIVLFSDVGRCAWVFRGWCALNDCHKAANKSKAASLRDIPQSVSIITTQQIKDRNADTFDQLARRIPGMRVLSNDDGRSSVYARGYEYSEANVDGLSAPMAGIYGSLPNLFAFDRVELMRGPSGLFDSSGEMGGTVNLVRKRPTADFQGHFAAAGGTQKQ